MNLSTNYLGFKLRTPLVPSASPLSEKPDNIKRLEDAGASAIVFHSLFEEQLRRDHRELHYYLEQGTESYAESLSFFPQREEFKVGPEAYLDHIARAKAAVRIPIIGSLNGSTFGGWMTYAREVEQAGADALELNIYNVPSDPDRSAADIENDYLTILSSIKAQVKIPVAIKLSPFFTNFAQFARRLDRQGRTRSSSSTASTNRTSSWKRSRFRPTSCLAHLWRCACRCVGLHCFMGESGPAWPRPAGSIARAMRSKC
jgi:dihydroorotate dehydrogenase (fumarate)